MSGRDLFGRPLPTGLGSRSLSSSSAVSIPDPNEELKRSAFRTIKPPCVALMGLASTPPTQHSPHAAALERVRSAAASLPDAAFTPALINYLLFPLTTTLRQAASPATLPAPFLEAAFRLLALVVSHWKRVPGGMEAGAWEQLWRFVVAAVSGSGKGKEKEKEKEKGKVNVDDEVRLEALRALLALLEPASYPGGTHPTPAMRRSVNGASAPLTPTLFASISLAIEASTPLGAHPTEQRTAATLLRTLLAYLAGQERLLASVLPGVVSAVAKALTRDGKSTRGDIAATLAGALCDVVVETLDDEGLRREGVIAQEVGDLYDLARAWESQRAEQRDVEDESEIPGSPKVEEEETKPDPFPPLTGKYLEFTAQQLHATVPPVLSVLTAHTSHDARTAAAELAASLLSHCRAALPRLVPASLSALLLLSTDEFDPVRVDAEERLRSVLDSADCGADPDSPDLDDALLALLSGGINALPRLIRSGADARVAETARLVTAIANVTSRATATAKSDGRPNAIASLLGPTGAVERWAWALLDCLELGRPRGWSTGAGGAARTAELGWNTGAGGLPLLIDAGGEGTPAANGDAKPSPSAQFPHLPLAHVESDRTARALSDMLEALGSAGGEAALHSVEYLMRFAKSHRTRDAAKAVSAVWVAERLLRGVAGKSAGTDSGNARPAKAVRKMAREVANVLVAMDEEEDEDAEWDGAEAADSTAAAQEAAEGALIERTKGVDQLTTLLDRTPRNSSAAHETRRLHAAAQRVLLTAVSLRALSTCAAVLGTGFRPLLLHALYLVLAHLSSPHELVRTCASAALAAIAFQAGYASPQTLVLANVDYVVNVVSQRLTYHRLSAHAPLVLIAMIRLVGAPIVPLVHDVVDEIFDALDDFHGYTALASALLAVLTTLIDAMADEPDPEAVEPSAAKKAEREAERAAEKRVLQPPEPRKDFALFPKWYAERGVRAQAQVEDLLRTVPQRPWGELGEDGKPKAKEGKDEMDVDSAPADDAETPPTRTQRVAAQILEKATFYLSHGSPFLRARVLGLIARAIPVLADAGREGDLLPVIDRAWPSILARLDDAPYVATAAAEAISALAGSAGAYVSRRIADDAWPRLLKLLKNQAAADARSALARRGAAGSTTEHAVSHRMYAALLSTATFIASEVAVKDAVLWDMGAAFRPLLDIRVHADLQAQARALYAALYMRDGDALWVLLRATTRKEGGVWAYLYDAALDITHNAEMILAL